MTDKMPPGFNLDAEASRQQDAQSAGIVARDNPPETDAESPVNGVPGDAHDDDDAAVMDHDEDVLGEDI